MDHFVSAELSNESEETHSTELSAEDSGEKVQKVQSKSKKTSKKEKTKSQKIVFPNKSISNLSRGLGPNDWIKLANALGFLPQVNSLFDIMVIYS